MTTDKFLACPHCGQTEFGFDCERTEYGRMEWDDLLKDWRFQWADAGDAQNLRCADTKCAKPISHLPYPNNPALPSEVIAEELDIVGQFEAENIQVFPVAIDLEDIRYALENDELEIPFNYMLSVKNYVRNYMTGDGEDLAAIRAWWKQLPDVDKKTIDPNWEMPA